MIASRTYRALLWSYPEDYRAMFAAEMLDAFEKGAAEGRRQGTPAFVRFVLAEWIGLLAGSAAEWMAKLTTSRTVRGRSLPDLRMMRPPGIPREVWFSEACLSAGPSSDEVTEAERRVADLVSRMLHAIANHDFPVARSCSYQEREARENLRRLREKHGIDAVEGDPCW